MVRPVGGWRVAPAAATDVLQRGDAWRLPKPAALSNCASLGWGELRARACRWLARCQGRPSCMEGAVGQGSKLPSPFVGSQGQRAPLTPASPPLSHFRREGSWGECVRCGWLCKLLGRRRLPLSPSLCGGRGGRGVRGSGLGVALSGGVQLSAGSSPHPGFATPLPLTGRGVVGGVCEVWLVGASP